MQEDHHLKFTDVIKGYPHFPQGRRHHNQTKSPVANPCNKQIVKNSFVSSHNMVPEIVSVNLVIQDHTCHPLINLVRFICIEEGTELPLQVSLLSIFLIGFIKIPHQNLLHSPRLWIDVSIFFQSLIKITPLLCPAYSTSPLLLWGNLKSPLIFIIYLVIDEFRHLGIYHLCIPPFIIIQLWCKFRSHFSFRVIVLILSKNFPWNICIYHTSNIAVNRDVILLLPYLQTTKQSQK